MSPRARPRIVLVGCGRQASRAHLPVLQRLRGRVDLVAVVDLADREHVTRERCAAFGFDSGVEFVSDATPMPECDGVIVSSPPLTHKRYIDAALAARGTAVLVDKPVTVRANARSSVSEARALVDEFEDVRRRARGRLAMVATQRRYHPLYRRIARHLHGVHAKTGQGVTFVQSLTNDGLWSDDTAYTSGAFYDPAATGGGKLINTGYHLLDTVPWLLRHCQGRDAGASDVARIASADVFAQFFGANDAAGIAAPLNEINACLQIAFRDDRDRTVCLWQLGALHGGISARRSPTPRVDDDAGRTKQDVLTIYQGPVAAVWMRRIAKLVPREGTEVGEAAHAELLCAQNPHLTGADGALEQVVGPYVDADTAPTEEFLGALLGGDAAAVASPVADQSIAVRLLAVAYESAALRSPVRVEFAHEDWALPPAASSYLQ